MTWPDDEPRPKETLVHVEAISSEVPGDEKTSTRGYTAFHFPSHAEIMELARSQTGLPGGSVKIKAFYRKEETRVLSEVGFSAEDLPIPRDESDYLELVILVSPN